VPQDTSQSKYPRFITGQAEPFDPIELAHETEKIICRGSERKYTDFYATGVYRGIATGYAVGCSLRCIFCWSDWSRDYPEKYGSFYSPEEAYRELESAARRTGVEKLRISGSEPTIGKDHLLSLLELVEKSEFSLFILETNGMLFGFDRDYVEKISRFKKPHIRISLKAGTPEGLRERTGAVETAFELPYNAIKNLQDYGVSFHVAAMTDPRLMPLDERKRLIQKLRDIDLRLVRNLEEEVADPYQTTIARLEAAGTQLKWA
jgi:uncharacterized Fe-S cluster-containing radical SAM superfamily protein